MATPEKSAVSVLRDTLKAAFFDPKTHISNDVYFTCTEAIDQIEAERAAIHPAVHSIADDLKFREGVNDLIQARPLSVGNRQYELVAYIEAYIADLRKERQRLADELDASARAAMKSEACAVVGGSDGTHDPHFCNAHMQQFYGQVCPGPAVAHQEAKAEQAGEIATAHERLSFHCVAITNQGAPMSLVERIDELYSWYASIVNDTDTTPSSATSAPNDADREQFFAHLQACSDIVKSWPTWKRNPPIKSAATGSIGDDPRFLRLLDAVAYREDEAPRSTAEIDALDSAKESACAYIDARQPVAAPSDPMDWPLPCDVKIGAGTIRKGCKLRTLALRAKGLHRMLMDATPAPTPEQRAAIDALFGKSAAPVAPAQAVTDGPELMAVELDMYQTLYGTKFPEAAVTDVLDERQRQKDVEGWTPDHDDEHGHGQMAQAAAAYAIAGSSDGRAVGDELEPSITERLWPWSRAWWKPNGRRRNLVKAAALLIAEIERLDRATPTGASK